MFGNIMKQVQKAQENVQKIQEELENMEIEGTAGAGMAKAVMNGRGALLNLEVDDNIYKESKDVALDVIQAAVNDAINKIAKIKEEKMGDMASNLGLPAGFKLPFMGK